MSNRIEFTALADLLREASIFIDSLNGDNEIELSPSQQVQAAGLVDRLDRLDEALRVAARVPDGEAPAGDPS